MNERPNFYPVGVVTEQIEGWLQNPFLKFGGMIVHVDAMVWFSYFISGVSNSNVARIKLPTRFALHSKTYVAGVGWGTDNGVVLQNPIKWSIKYPSSFIEIYPNSLEGPWTAFGEKAIHISGYYWIDLENPYMEE